MTPSSLRAADRPRTTYARARLRLGIAGVGTWVVVATAALLFELPQALLPTATSWSLDDLRGLALWMAAVAVLTAPFDVLGGHVLPRAHGRSERPFVAWLAAWLRGVAVQTTLWLGFALALLASGRWLGDSGALLALVAGMTALLAAQSGIARLLAPFGRGRVLPGEVIHALQQWRVPAPERVEVLETDDPGFTGGVVGIPGNDSHVVPAAWLDRFEPRTTALLLARRVALVDRGSRQQGVLMALIWNLAGFVLASVVPGASTDSVAGLASLVAAFTLWSFVGLLLLPSVSRPAVHSGDKAALELSGDRDLVERAIRGQDRLLDDEPQRAVWVERIFHPVPSVDARIAQFGGSLRGPAPPWHAARMTLYTSWACLNPLARVVHCNAGRPELWAMLPAD